MEGFYINQRSVIVMLQPMKLPQATILFPYTTLFRSGKNVLIVPQEIEGVVINQRSGNVRRQPIEFPHDTVRDRKSTRLNSSHITNSYAVFCLKKKRTVSCRNTIG